MFTGRLGLCADPFFTGKVLVPRPSRQSPYTYVATVSYAPAAPVVTHAAVLGWLLLSASGLVWALYATSVQDIDILSDFDEGSSVGGGLIWVYDLRLPRG